MEKNKLTIINNKPTLSLKRTLTLLISGFTVPIQPIIIHQKALTNNTQLGFITSKEVNRHNNHFILNIIEKSTLCLHKLFKKKGITSSELHNNASTMQILEDAVSFKQPSAGSSKYVSYLNKLKFIE